MPEVDELVRSAGEVGFPLFVKAAAGGGGRGLRRVETADELRAAVEAAVREAETAFGDPTVFLEEAVTRPRHIEVQVLADATGEVVHLYERDCSVQRRHQKVVEIAPAPNLPAGLAPALGRRRSFARAVGYRNAGTVEFLVDAVGRHVFIEMNPRIQVEHTVTEEVTAIDLVQAQLQIGGRRHPGRPGHLAGGHRRHRGRAPVPDHDRGPGSRLPARHGPDNGLPFPRRPWRAPRRLRLPGGGRFAPFRLAAGQVDVPGAHVRRGRGPRRRAVAEFRVRGVATNIPFLQALLAEPDFIAGNLTTAFIDERPGLLSRGSGADRGTRLLNYMADVTVNRPHGPAPSVPTPKTNCPPTC